MPSLSGGKFAGKPYEKQNNLNVRNCKIPQVLWTNADKKGKPGVHTTTWNLEDESNHVSPREKEKCDRIVACPAGSWRLCQQISQAWMMRVEIWLGWDEKRSWFVRCANALTVTDTTTKITAGERSAVWILLLYEIGSCLIKCTWVRFRVFRWDNCLHWFLLKKQRLNPCRNPTTSSLCHIFTHVGTVLQRTQVAFFTQVRKLVSTCHCHLSFLLHWAAETKSRNKQLLAVLEKCNTRLFVSFNNLQCRRTSAA